ncbi:RNA N6-adenosine-methyltransferase mettl16-like isoform X1 [Branchiostoma floridae]|uniref:U6 small nuclear RNA (adenine-(43)-N(6))-methyltransferase n=1 Tax=Branchiostoma floridae TaxID=7739 RepID=A0A9J7LZY2_BRAFL|nr:RNA N6-adenosine-methyltransferase mettl16-like isoform X1 [Branchiostoma floridae]
MALNKYMHPRNKYKNNPPDFAVLAKKYPDFAQYVTYNKSETRGFINFKDPEAMRCLTCTLLKEDFGLEVEIPNDRLIPTLPLRLNYIHWIEDLLQGMDDVTKEAGDSGKVTGIDIGAGACCIYPLLGCTLNGWNFLATEVDPTSYTYAVNNVSRNNKQDNITVKSVKRDEGLLKFLNEDESYFDFCMCNPPFYANDLEAQGLLPDRGSERPLPSSISTASEAERVASGGEVGHVSRIILESLQLQQRIGFYTSMLGKKSSLKPLKEMLKENGIENFTCTEFCQGRTMRWGIVWTFHKDITLPTSPLQKKKSKPPIRTVVPEKYLQHLMKHAAQTGGMQNTRVQLVSSAIKQLLGELQVPFQECAPPSPDHSISLTLTPTENTWIHNRKRRRQKSREAAEGLKHVEQPLMLQFDTPEQKEQQPNTKMEEEKMEHDGSHVGEGGKSEKLDDTDSKKMETSDDAANGTTSPGKRGASEEAAHEEFLFKACLSISMIDKGIVMEMGWLEGKDKDGMNQLVCYLKSQFNKV